MIELLPNMYDKLHEGHIGWFESRQEKLRDIIKQLKPLNLIEIGFNMGHSCKLICDTIIELKDYDSDYKNKEANFYVFDICVHKRTEGNFNIIQHHYRKDITLSFIKGSSQDTVKNFMRDKDNIFDFIEIDGAHTKEAVSSDITDTFNKVRRGGVMYIDDYESTEIPCPLVEDGIHNVNWQHYRTGSIDGVFWGVKI